MTAEELLWRVSSGTASVLGLRPMVMDVAPTTAYLMLGARCSQDCAFCSQARSSQASDAALSRVMWPQLPAEEVAEAVSRAVDQGHIGRVCFQVTTSPGYLELTARSVALLAATRVPICACVAAPQIADIQRLLDAGAERVTLALDAATESLYRATKKRDGALALRQLRRAAQRYPGHLGTHLIVGLGETEQEMASRMQSLADWGVSVALFAFTPVRGTQLQDAPPPPLTQYRRLQAASWLIRHHLARCEQFQYDSDGKIVSLGLAREDLRAALADGEAFRTSGCSSCNRPYYNERPGGTIYNYARPLTVVEAEHEVQALVASLAG